MGLFYDPIVAQQLHVSIAAHLAWSTIHVKSSCQSDSKLKWKAELV